MGLSVEHKKWIDRCIWEMRKAVTPRGYDSPTVGNIYRDASATTYWAGITVDGHIHHDNNQACHAGLSSVWYGQVYDYETRKYVYSFPGNGNLAHKPLYVVHRIQWEDNYEPLPKECIDAFLRWLTKESAYSSIFVQNGGAVLRKRGYLVAYTDVPANLLAGGLIAARMITEHKGSIAFVWWKLVQRGVHPAIAFYHAHEVSCYDQKNITTCPQDSHTPLDYDEINKATVRNFKNGVMADKCANYEDSQYYFPISGAWAVYGPNNGAPYVDDIKDEVLQGATVEAVVNPFLVVRLKKECDVDEFCTIWAKQLIEHYGEDNA